MVTNYPQQLTAGTAGTSAVPVGATGIARLMGRLGQVLCGLRGHDSVLHVAGSRMMMRCTSCGYDTPGWDVNGRAPRRRFEGDSRRHSIAKPRLVLKKSA
ncbi:MAG TPA: hypothetical protein VLD67_21235 [Vicinamibacterales bacterium]|nr:hypothetical protein [Vicinamibacterales bacterium]